jgi:ribonuclease P/MRP protein subunit RPP1
MTEFYDLCLRETSEEVRELAEELGWTATNCEFETVFLEADNWGELKKKIKHNRDDVDVLVFKGGNVELNRKAAEDARVDVLLHPEKGRKDSGIDHVIAEEAAKNKVAIGFDLQQLMENNKQQTHALTAWRKNLRLCEKYDTPYTITSGAQEKLDLRAPRELAAVIKSLDFKGNKAVSKYPKKILERAERVNKDGFIRPGEKVEKNGR